MNQWDHSYSTQLLQEFCSTVKTVQLLGLQFAQVRQRREAVHQNAEQLLDH